MTFLEVLTECSMNKELVKQFNRLSGTNLSFEDKREPIERMVDDATGYNNPFKNKHEEMIQFIRFVFECVWDRLHIEEKELYAGDCIRCGQCCLHLPCYYAQKEYGLKDNSKICPDLKLEENGKYTCLRVARDSQFKHEMIGTGCFYPHWRKVM